MIRRPIDKRFVAAVLKDEKVTTIRENPWPVGVPIMLYVWTDKPYRSKQHNIRQVIVEETCRVWIHHHKDGGIYYSHGQLWVTEGFNSAEDMAEWFRAVVPRGQDVPKTLMRFRRIQP
jgi:hypothetical protein